MEPYADKLVHTDTQLESKCSSCSEYIDKLKTINALASAALLTNELNANGCLEVLVSGSRYIDERILRSLLICVQSLSEVSDI